MRHIGIDLGGTKIEVAVLGDNGEFLLRRRCDTPTGYYSAILENIHCLVKEAEKEFGEKLTVGIGIPGSPSPTTGLIRNANSTCLNGQELQTDLEALLKRKIRIANDANCFALSEAIDGAGTGARSVFGVILGTGTGGGIVIDGNIVEGKNGVSGEWGHNPLPWMSEGEFPGPSCWCGKTGCIETFLSGPGLSRNFHLETGRNLSACEIADAASRGDEEAELGLQRYESRLARGLASVINLLDPDVIVLGGGLSNLPRLYENVPTLLHEHVFSDRVRTSLRPPAHGDSSGVRGAAWLWSS